METVRMLHMLYILLEADEKTKMASVRVSRLFCAQGRSSGKWRLGLEQLRSA